MKDYVDLRVELAATKLESDISSLRKDIQLLGEKLPTKWMIVATVAAALVSLLTILAIMGDRFDGGFAASSSFASEVSENREALEDLAAQQRETQQTLDAILSALERGQSEPSEGGE